MPESSANAITKNFSDAHDKGVSGVSDERYVKRTTARRQGMPDISESRAIVMTHRCHWPNCQRAVPPKLWGCREHWFKLPKVLRDKIWRTYRPGQEITKTPSPAYIEAAIEVQRWIQDYRGGSVTRRRARQRSKR